MQRPASVYAGSVRPGAAEKRVVWIFGSPRSGSTWLLEMLAEHDRIVPINEPLIGLHLGPFVSDRPGSRAEDLDLSNFTFSRLAGEVPTYFFSRRHADVWAPALRDLIVKRLAVHARRRDLIVVKEPNGSQAADTILRALPRSRLLFLLRDGRDVVDSELAAFATGSWMSRRYGAVRGIETGERLQFLTQAAHKWVWRTDVVQGAFDAHRGPKLLVRYEELLAETEGQMQRVWDWLRLNPVALEAIVERHSFVGATSGSLEFARAAQPGQWRENLTDEEQARIVEIMGPTLARLGYSPD
jgi:Sulfotransferase family